MADAPVVDIAVPVASEPDQQIEVYSPTVAAKDSAWMVGKLSASLTLVPQVVSFLGAFGISLDVNGYAYKALPYIVFVVLHLLHDYASVKSKMKWV